MKKVSTLFIALAMFILAAGAPALAATLQVGPGKTYAVPSEAAAEASDGDVIEIDAGLYSGDVASWYAGGITIRGVGGMAHLDAAGENAEGKAIWVIKGDDVTVEYIEFSGATVPDQNGAGIRAEGSGLTIRHCSFHDNEEGILGGAGEVLIEYSEFGNNGYGDGYSHNMYLSGNVTSFTLRFCYSHHARVGHIVKSRAQVNFILYNRLMDEGDGTSSYTLDLPNGGTSFVIGNLIQQGPATENSGIFAYAAEGATNPSSDLYVACNTFVNDRGSGTFISNRGPTAAVVVDNIFVGGGAVLSGPGDLTANLETDDAGLVDRAGYDYHLAAGSPAIDAGTDPGTGGGRSLAPEFQYVHPAGAEPRAPVGAIDIGAYEFGNAPPPDEEGEPDVAEQLPDAGETIPDLADDTVPADVAGDWRPDAAVDTTPADGVRDALAEGDAGEPSEEGGCGCAVVL
jgi:hypothetical protein